MLTGSALGIFSWAATGRNRMSVRILDDSGGEIALPGTAAGIAPVLTVDRRLVGDGKVGPITKSLLEGYSEVVLGKNTLGHEDWVTKVY